MPCEMSMGPLSAGVPLVGRLGAVLLHVEISLKLDCKWYVHYASGVKYSHFTCIWLAKLYEKLLTGGQSCFTLPISKINTGHDV